MLFKYFLCYNVILRLNNSGSVKIRFVENSATKERVGNRNGEGKEERERLETDGNDSCIVKASMIRRSSIFFVKQRSCVLMFFDATGQERLFTKAISLVYVHTWARGDEVIVSRTFITLSQHPRANKA